MIPWLELPVLYHWATYNNQTTTTPQNQLHIILHRSTVLEHFIPVTQSVCMNNYYNSICYLSRNMISSILPCNSQLWQDAQEKTLNIGISQRLYTRLLLHEWTAWCTNGNLYHACIQQVKPHPLFKLLSTLMGQIAGHWVSLKTKPGLQSGFSEWYSYHWRTGIGAEGRPSIYTVLFLWLYLYYLKQTIKLSK